MTTTEIESRLTALESEVADLRKMLEDERITQAMRRSIHQFERGEGKPALEVAESLARKYGIQNS